MRNGRGRVYAGALCAGVRTASDARARALVCVLRRGKPLRKLARRARACVCVCGVSERVSSCSQRALACWARTAGGRRADGERRQRRRGDGRHRTKRTARACALAYAAVAATAAAALARRRLSSFLPRKAWRGARTFYGCN